MEGNLKVMKIIYIMRNALHLYPPCLSQILFLNDYGIDLLVACGNFDSSIENLLNRNGIRYKNLNVNRKYPGIIGKIENYKSYRSAVSKLLKEEYTDGDILWFGTADSCFMMSALLAKEKYKYVLSVLELYDNNKFYQKGLAKVINDASIVIACESTRAAIMKSWWNLDKKPFVMPNKPYSHPREKKLEGSTPMTKAMIDRIQGCNVLLYQGIISVDRDLGVLAEALKQINMDLTLVMMGKEIGSNSEKIKDIYPKTIYLGYVPAPLHLEITSHALIGIANYDYSCLNNLFCAPNKIYEYAGFGIPILCNDVPGLVNTIGMNKAGVCVNFTSKDEIAQAILEIYSNYSKYEKNAFQFYDSTDNNVIMAEIVHILKKG